MSMRARLLHPMCDEMMARWAMAVLMTGMMPVCSTLRMSMPVGTPLKLSRGTVTFGFSAVVISAKRKCTSVIGFCRPVNTFASEIAVFRGRTTWLRLMWRMESAMGTHLRVVVSMDNSSYD